MKGDPFTALPLLSVGIYATVKPGRSLSDEQYMLDCMLRFVIPVKTRVEVRHFSVKHREIRDFSENGACGHIVCNQEVAGSNPAGSTDVSY